MNQTHSALLLTVLTCLTIVSGGYANAEIQRYSVTSGKILVEGESPKNEAVISVHHPEHPNGCAILIHPGGGYGGLVTDGEGHGIAKWLGSHGITGVVLEYRLPNGDCTLPLSDTRRALQIIRSHAADWKIRQDSIGNMGFSAGGHLASVAATHFVKGEGKSTDPISRSSSRPDFSILVYPVITMGETSHGGSRSKFLGPEPDQKKVDLYSSEKQVSKETPPAFLAHAKDDALVTPANSRMYYDALKAAGVEAEYLELESGGHGLNGYQGPMWEAWKSASLKWLAKAKFIPASVAN